MPSLLFLWLSHKGGDVPGGFGFCAGLLQKSQIPEPINKSILPGAKRHSVAVRQPGAHARAVAQNLAGVPAIAIHMHFDVGNGCVKHRGEILVCPDGVNAVARASAYQERRRRAAAITR
jgi:hypothetical protein